MDMSQHATLLAEKTQATETANKLEKHLFIGTGIFAAGWVASGFLFGVVGIAMPALALVPVAFSFIILLTKG